MKILVTTSSFDIEGSEALTKLASQGFEITGNPHGRRLTEDEARTLLSDPEIVGMIAGVETLSRAVLETAPSLRIVSRCGAGIDTVDLAAAEERQIEVLRTPDAPTAAVAELAIGLMLATLRSIPLGDRAMRSGEWVQKTGALLGTQTVGIVGYGRIGRRVGRLAAAFGAGILAADSFVMHTDPGVDLVSLDELVERSTIISLHVPMDETTRNLFDAARLAKMRQGSILLNTSRGGLVNEDDLHHAISSGHLAGAGIDTFEEEPYSGPLCGLEQVVLSPHVGSRAKETRKKMEKEASDNLLSALVQHGMARD